jgi:NAD-dependent SIR2 family protein deacetylase
MARPKIALIVGAGFSCEAGLPSTKQIVESFLKTPQNGELDHRIETEISKHLKEFWKYAFNYNGRSDKPSLEDHFTVLDLAANTGRNIGPEYPPKKLRAIRRLSIHRVFQILDLPKGRDSGAIQQALSVLYEDSEPQIISTNWDIVAENRMRERRIPYWYGLPVEDLNGREMPCEGITLLMLHGSANWIYCDSCRRLYAGQPANEKAALRALIYIDTDDFRELCPENEAVVKLVSEIPRQPKHCVHCGNRLGARIATFSYRKEVSIPQFQAIWQRAFDILRDSDSWLFIGYSLPEADFEFRHLLKSAEKASRSYQPKRIWVIVKDDCDAARRFRRFFGMSDDQIHQHGLSECMESCFPAWLDSLTRGVA